MSQLHKRFGAIEILAFEDLAKGADVRSGDKGQLPAARDDDHLHAGIGVQRIDRLAEFLQRLLVHRIHRRMIDHQHGHFVFDGVTNKLSHRSPF